MTKKAPPMSNNRPSLPACAPSGKMVSYGTGKAPTLNYRVPQRTSFTTYGDISLNLPADFFAANAKTVPAEVAQYAGMSIADIAALLRSKNEFPTKNKPLVLKNLENIDKSSLNTEGSLSTDVNVKNLLAAEPTGSKNTILLKTLTSIN
jgi:hypothetical protein